jgi:hypothetical protein
MTRSSVVKFCQSKTDGFIDMSRSLSRIRNLVSEIEEIHRQGQQQGGQAAGKTTYPMSASVSAAPLAPVSAVVSPVISSVVVQTVAPTALPVATPVAPVVASSVERVQISPAQKVSSPPPLVPPEAEADPFLEIAHMVNLDESKTTPAKSHQAGKVSMQLSGAVALSLQIQNTGETIEVKQIGNMLEIRFADGKAFHLPLKLVA